MSVAEDGSSDSVRSLADDGPFSASLLYAAAKIYYEDDATQAEVASRLGVSRPTVSRILAEARRRGIVRITVIPPSPPDEDDLSDRLARGLRLQEVYLTSSLPTAASGRATEDVLGSLLAPTVGRALLAAGLVPGDVLLVSSGRTMYEVTGFDLPKLPGVVVAPTVGGTEQPEAWFQTNEIVRRIAVRIGGHPSYLFAPALPGPELFETLKADPTIQRVLNLWSQARVVLAGVGAPPSLRSQFPYFGPIDTTSLREAVGDICSRFYNEAGHPVPFPGSDRLIALQLEDLQQLPVVIAVASGAVKVASIIAGARAGYFNRLVTDPLTATQILADRRLAVAS